MKDVIIEEVGIDKEDRLYIKPKGYKLPYIYREAMGIHWSEVSNTLYSPAPGEWTYLQWYLQIAKAARKQSVRLLITSDTKWLNIPAALQKEITPVPAD